MHAREVIEQLAAILDRVDARQFWLERREAQLFSLRFVHEAAIEVADELLVGAGWRAGAARFLGDGLQVLFRRRRAAS